MTLLILLLLCFFQAAHTQTSSYLRYERNNVIPQSFVSTQFSNPPLQQGSLLSRPTDPKLSSESPSKREEEGDKSLDYASYEDTEDYIDTADYGLPLRPERPLPPMASTEPLIQQGPLTASETLPQDESSEIPEAMTQEELLEPNELPPEEAPPSLEETDDPEEVNGLSSYLSYKIDGIPVELIGKTIYGIFSGRKYKYHRRLPRKSYKVFRG